MLTTDKHCEMLSADARDEAAEMVGGFRLFVQLYSAIVGGAVFFGLQLSDQVTASLVLLSDVFVTLITVASMLLVGDGFRAWWRHRKELSEVAGKDAAGNSIIPGPNPRQGITFIVMLATMAIALILFWMFNPLRVA